MSIRTMVLAGVAVAAAGLSCGQARAEGPQCPTDIMISPKAPADACFTGAIVGSSPEQVAIFAWENFISLNWPAQAGTREKPDAALHFGGNAAPTVWETMRAKVEVYPGNASPLIGPHGAKVSGPYKATNQAEDFGYDQAPDYFYDPKKVGTKDGRIAACPAQTPVAKVSWMPLDETTEIYENQTFAGHLPAVDPTGLNSAPQMIRYAVKIGRVVYTNVTGQGFWSGSADKTAPLYKALQNYTKTLAQGQNQDPPNPYVDFIATQSPAVELKAAWRPLTEAEAQSGRFHTSTVRYYESNAGAPCYHEAVWGLVGLHFIAQTPHSPWMLWSSFEQEDNILTPDGKPTEDADGKVIVPQPGQTPTTPALTSDPNLADPKVEIVGGAPYCDNPGSRLYFRENPHLSALPSQGRICVNTRWHAIPDPIIAINQKAHAAIQAYLDQLSASAGGAVKSPWLHYKLVNVQAIPVNPDQVSYDAPSYYTANSVIETDYPLGMFSGNLTQAGAPSNVVAVPGGTKPYYNTTLLPFQGVNAVGPQVNMGGCAGCHDGAAQIGANFSFALGDTVKAPQPVKAFDASDATQAIKRFRIYDKGEK